MAAELLDHGQELTLRTRRGADLVFTLTLKDGGGSIIDITGATTTGRIYSAGQPDVAIPATVNGPAGQITVHLTAATTKQLPQDSQYVFAYILAGVVKPLIFGAFEVSQGFL